MSKSGTIWAMIASVLSPILALLGVISCCGLPILVGILATLGIGASQLSFFAEYKGWFIGFAIISLLFGFYQAYFKKETCGCGCETGVSETNLKKQSKSKSFQKLFLWLGVAIIVFVLFIGNKNKTGQNNENNGCCPVETQSTLAEENECCETQSQPKQKDSCCDTIPNQ
ncbi:hypothetical protein NXX17_10175 [Bacteroides fragilis]|nr:hypothetical protein NXX17_10175 [Bacteroides fragilis]